MEPDEAREILIKNFKEHPNCMNTEKSARALIMDSIPGLRAEKNIMITLYREGMIDELRSCIASLLLRNKYKQILTKEYCFSEIISVWCIDTWIYIVEELVISDTNESWMSNEPDNRKKGNKAYLLNQLGLKADDEGDCCRAIKFYRGALKQGGLQPHVHWNLGYALYRLSFLEKKNYLGEAKKHLRIASDYRNPDAAFILANIYDPTENDFFKRYWAADYAVKYYKWAIEYSDGTSKNPCEYFNFLGYLYSYIFKNYVAAAICYWMAYFNNKKNKEYRKNYDRIIEQHFKQWFRGLLSINGKDSEGFEKNYENYHRHHLYYLGQEEIELLRNNKDALQMIEKYEY